MLVSLKEFAATGTFGPVTLGCPRSDLERHLGAPEDLGGTSRKVRRPTIWKYGDVEFCFPSPGDALDMIHIDRFSGPGAVPIGWRALSIDPWVLRRGLARQDFCREADAATLPYTARYDESMEQWIVEFTAGVSLGFLDEPDGFSDLIGLAWVAQYQRRGT